MALLRGEGGVLDRLCDAGHRVYEPLTHLRLRGCAVFDGDHFTLFAQYAADIGPLLMFFA